MTSWTDAYGRDLRRVEAARRWASERTPEELRAAVDEWTRALATRGLVGDEALRYEAAHAALRAAQ